MTDPITYHAVLYRGCDGAMAEGPPCKTRDCAVQTITPLDNTTVLGLVELDIEPGPAYAFRKRNLANAPTQSPDEWRCFHCDQRFTDSASAAKHFGSYEVQDPACLVDVAKFREHEAALARYRQEDSDKDREIARLRSGFATDLRREEERGYARGLADARKHPAEAATAIAPAVPKGMLAWALERWFEQVAHRPLVNVHRRSLDSVWRQVMRYCGADDVVLCGPRHDELVAESRATAGAEVARG
ncbi:hypothetical protein ASD78_12095 [Lysobacter sp. Root667]|uniref:hypothetical protein n=1 Tax=Lysobacter sp. Root667 TaxID=1736581 RepID=UPI0006FCA196|nr:hypothetical protein [Lysobacter sp. Root667]KRA74229.1 hypothetical protein ASD78_12095 [Lysobacter sp. Root667]